jgi:hypothetical protein
MTREWILVVAVSCMGTSSATAAPEEASGAPTPAPSAIEPGPHAPPSGPSPAPRAEAALRRVLSSGCLDGLDAIYPMTGDPAAPWAETVLRLCGEILRDQPLARRPAAGNSADEALAVDTMSRRHEPSPQEGRGRLVLWSSLYGIWLGAAADVLLDVQGSRAVILPPMLGLAAGLGLSLQLTRDVPVTVGQAWTIITGVDYGSVNGALWAAAFDAGSKAVVGTALATGFAATAAGLAVADAASPSAGDVELVRSGLLWGGTAGFLTVAALSPSGSFDGNGAALGAAAAMDAGFLVALALARQLEVSRNRVLIIDAAALGGGLAGLGVAWLSVGNAADDRPVLTGAALVGLVGGIAVAAYGTRDLDKGGRDVARGTSPVPALVARDPDGGWGLGSPAPLPVLDSAGRRLVGATVSALGGAF